MVSSSCSIREKDMIFKKDTPFPPICYLTAFQEAFGLKTYTHLNPNIKPRLQNPSKSAYLTPSLKPYRLTKGTRFQYREREREKE